MQQLAPANHVERAGERIDHADRRDVEHAHGEARALECRLFGGDTRGDDVGRRADEREGAAEHRGERERHEERAAGMPSPLAHSVTMGRNIAHTGVLFMKATQAAPGSARDHRQHVAARLAEQQPREELEAAGRLHALGHRAHDAYRHHALGAEAPSASLSVSTPQSRAR